MRLGDLFSWTGVTVGIILELRQLIVTLQYNTLPLDEKIKAILNYIYVLY